MGIRLGILVASFLFSGSVFAHVTRTEAPPAVEEAEPNVEHMMNAVVKIVTKTADIFSGETSGGHGSGFFVGIDPKSGRGLIFTNKHVIETESWTVQNISLEFNTQQRRAESVQAEIRYISDLHDFAVLEFDPSHLQRAELAPPLALPTSESPFFDFVRNERSLRGLSVLAIGNPLATSNVTTYGHITALFFDPNEGPFIQTDAPINPGNSGGPLISLNTGEVIGINSRTFHGADGTHQCIPIGVLIEEYKTWEKQQAEGIHPDIGATRFTAPTLQMMSESGAKIAGIHDKVNAAAPGYWSENHGILFVSDAAEDGALQNDDVLLRLNGEVIGGFPYDLNRLMHFSPVQAKLTVLRHGQLIDVDYKIDADSYGEVRRTLDYVYISGLMFNQMPKRMASVIRPGLESTVAVSRVVETPEANFSGASFPNPGSILAFVSFGEKDYPIRNLFDLKKAINLNRDKKYILLRMYNSNVQRAGDDVVLLNSNRYGTPLVDGRLSTYRLPMNDVMTPFQFRTYQFSQQFSFSPEDAHTRDWHAFRKADRLPSKCEALLQHGR